VTGHTLRGSTNTWLVITDDLKMAAAGERPAAADRHSSRLSFEEMPEGAQRWQPIRNNLDDC
jgi:hypothetical protein